MTFATVSLRKVVGTPLQLCTVLLLVGGLPLLIVSSQVLQTPVYHCLELVVVPYYSLSRYLNDRVRFSPH